MVEKKVNEKIHAVLDSVKSKVSEGTKNAIDGFKESNLGQAVLGDDGVLDGNDFKRYGEKINEAIEVRRQRSQEKKLEAKRNKLNPVFEDQLKSDLFTMPKLIQVIDVLDKPHQDPYCEGSIGWIDGAFDMRVFHILEAKCKILEELGYGVLPTLSSDTIYYKGLHRDKTFVALDGYFEDMKKAEVAELEKVARLLGAKHYSIELHEEENTKGSVKTKQGIGLKTPKDISVAGSASSGTSGAISNDKLLKIEAEGGFDNSVKPERPKLVWFRNNAMIQELIESRCNDYENHTMNTHRIRFVHNAKAAISISAAKKIDAAIADMGVKGEVSIQGLVEKESRKSFVFIIEF